MSADAAWVLGPFVFGAGVAIALALFDIGTALREFVQMGVRFKSDPYEEGIEEAPSVNEEE